MGFMRKQQERLAMRLLAWQYERSGQPIPGKAALEARAREVVDDAHRIAKQSGKNFMEIIKDLIQDIKK